MRPSPARPTGSGTWEVCTVVVSCISVCLLPVFINMISEVRKAVVKAIAPVTSVTTFIMAVSVVISIIAIVSEPLTSKW